MKNRFDNTSGYSFVELMTAIIIAGIVSTLIFSSYHLFNKNYHINAIKAEQVRGMTLAKKKIDNLFSAIDVIKEYSPVMIKYLSKNNDKREQLILIRNNVLYHNGKTVVKNINTFRFTVSDQESPDEICVISWECVLYENLWIGGAERVRRELY